MIRRRTVDVFTARPGEVAAPAGSPDGYRFRKLEAADFETSRLGQEKGRAQGFAKRIAQGHQPWGYLAPDGTVACYLWLSAPEFSEAPPDFELGLRARIPAGCAYVWDCRSDPRHERRGLYRHGLAALARCTADIGARSVLIVTRRENTRSRDSILAVGFRAAGTMRLFGLGNLVFIAGATGPALARAGSAVALVDAA